MMFNNLSSIDLKMIFIYNLQVASIWQNLSSVRKKVAGLMRNLTFTNNMFSWMTHKLVECKVKYCFFHCLIIKNHIARVIPMHLICDCAVYSQLVQKHIKKCTLINAVIMWRELTPSECFSSTNACFADIWSKTLSGTKWGANLLLHTPTLCGLHHIEQKQCTFSYLVGFTINLGGNQAFYWITTIGNRHAIITYFTILTC